MISVAEARSRILAGLEPVPVETVALSAALGRVLAEDATAAFDQPPFAASAMDGYAVRADDVAEPPVLLTVVDVSAAGRPAHSRITTGEAVRIFTGAPLPEGADTIVIQENVEISPDGARVLKGEIKGRYVRPAGLDFKSGDTLLRVGRMVGPFDVSLLAALDRSWVSVRRRPRVGLIATGDELKRPGQPRGPADIVNSNTFGLAAMLDVWGAEPIDLGIARDTEASLRAIADQATGLDLLISMGGASVGDHDLVRQVLGEDVDGLDFWKVAMRPGKPLMSGRFRGVPFLGLPGNPVSSLVCGIVFVLPAIARLAGLTADPLWLAREPGRLAAAMPENDAREEYVRATLARGADGIYEARPFRSQDSAMLSALARAEALIVRPPHAPAAPTGTSVQLIRLASVLRPPWLLAA